MSNITALTELAGFVGKSPLATADQMSRAKAVNALAGGIQHRPLHRKATDLLGVVLALSARTRRVVQPRVHIDLDVFGPNGSRAVTVIIP